MFSGFKIRFPLRGGLGQRSHFVSLAAFLMTGLAGFFEVVLAFGFAAAGSQQRRCGKQAKT